MYQALYRKWRPITFSQVVGQEHITDTLRRQVAEGRTGHAYLFTGTRGTGKTTCARILAKAINCLHPVDGAPCNQCEACRGIDEGRLLDITELDAASNNGVDSVRALREEAVYTPSVLKKRVYIIDEVHMLSIGAFNALLKTLEEPPSYVIFILATTEAHKIPITILSRCQRYDFKRITIDTITQRLQDLMQQEKVEVEDKALRYVAKAADGSMRDALSLLDQCIAFHYGEILTYDMVLDVLGAVDTQVFGKMLRRLADKNVQGSLSLLEEIILQGRELTQFVTDFIWYLRNLLLLKTSENIEDVVDVSTDNLSLMQEEAELVSENALMRYIRIFSELSGQLRYAVGKRIMIEMTLIKICRPSMETKNDALLERIRDLEHKLETGNFAAPQSTVAVAAQDAPAEELQERPQLPKAVPEDIQQVVGRWGEIVQKTGQPMRTYLSGSKLSLGGENRLLIVLPDGLQSDYFIKHPENKDSLQDLIGQVIGKEIQVEVRPLAKEQSFERSYIDLSQIVHMEIEEE